MSRLPVPRGHTLSSSESSNPIASSSTATSATMITSTAMNKSLKRKHDDDDGDGDGDERQQPARKLVRSTSTSGPPPLRTRATNQAGRLPSTGPAALTKPRAPSFTKPRSTAGPTRPGARTRATSVPPVSSRPTTRSATAARGRPGIGRGGRMASSGYNPSLGRVDEERFQQLQQSLQQQMTSMGQSIAAGVAADMEAERQKMLELQESQLTLSKDLAEAKSQELDRRKQLDSVSDEIEALRKKHAKETMELELDLRRKEREVRESKDEKREIEEQLEAERARTSTLKATISQMTTTHLTIESQKGALSAQLSALQAALDAEKATVRKLRFDIESRDTLVAKLETEAREFESVRRRMHNTILELKGNIRVFCRVRPVLSSDLPNGGRGASEEDIAKKKQEAMASMEFPDKDDFKEIVLSNTSENAMGQERKEAWNFSFDRVFEPNSTQSDVFEEVSLLAQSVMDGYNVCIFAYGQTGSGKSFTMEGGVSEESKGMIPRAVDKVFQVADHLRAKGWEYTIEGQFLEIYNETINDLLGHGEFDKKKHEIKHDTKVGTRVTDVQVLPLRSAAQVRQLLSLAQSRRTVAATLMNERSSRSHSVFTLRVTGVNALTGESCAGTLNLVDLAGSERLNASGAGSDKDRLRETQNINKSLSALGDVIAALGEKGEKGDRHIPYRNSKLTYLLQNSLSGDSKTLMILNISPLETSLGETLCSLRFATKVNNTHVGLAKKIRHGSA